MGFDKLSSFIYKNFPNNTIENVYLNNIYTYNHIFFDINFIIYNAISEIDDDVNNIIKNILSLSYSDNKLIINNINDIINKDYWKNLNLKFENILDGHSIDNIIDKLLIELNNYLTDILFNNILNKIIYVIENIHDINFIKSLNIFFDGIPSYSKILEQRKRRFNNYIEAQEKKKHYDDNFNITNYNLVNENGIIYDYFVYLKKNFSFNKSIGGNSYIFKNIENKFLLELQKKYSKIKIYINGSCNNGEADYKIFRYIYTEKITGDIVIHSCDSDFIFLILVFQIMENKKYNLNYIKYTYTNKKYNYELYRAHKIINIIIDKYKLINKIDNCFYNCIYDILFLIQMFENDILPINYDISVDLSFQLICETHYKFSKNKNFVINVNSKYIINFDNFKLWLENIKNENTFNYITFVKNFKIPYFVLNLFFFDLKYNIHQFIYDFIIPYLSWSGYNINDLDEEDIRYIFKNKYNINENPIDKLNIPTEKKNDLYKHLDNMFDYSDINNFGLKKLGKYNNIYNNTYQTVYEYIINNNINIDNIINFKEYVSKSSDVYQYMNVLISQTLILFYDFSLYSPKNKYYYGFNISPCIDDIINYINNNNYNTLIIDIIDNLQKKDILYFNNITHFLFITPYLFNSIYIEKINDIDNIKSLLNITNTIMKGIWYNDDFFILKNIEPDYFLNNCNNVINLLNSEFVKNINNYSKLLNF
jgi:hypothetical protein